LIYKSSNDVDLNNLKECQYNFTTERTNPVGKMDSSQVAFRIKSFQKGVRYPDNSKLTNDLHRPWLVNPDAGLFESMFNEFGNAPFTGLVAQYKGIHEHQLVWHKKQGKIGLKEYVDRINELGGDLL